ncbi:putative importin [Nosema granulosis]|uniref:Importin n=1 Tax=Nosema granulosis TaxID=83296 RepID=A0A9P6H069_9MICR|nr:putative importin [Nosema granulosis]
MNSEMKEIFKNTIDPNESVRKRSEEQLNKFQKDPNILLQLPQTLMKDKDPIIKNTSSLFFKNAVIAEWSNEYFQQTRFYIINNMHNYYADVDGVTLVAFNSILIHIYNTEKMDVIVPFLKNNIALLKSGNPHQVGIVLNILEMIFSAEKIKYNLEHILELIFNTEGQTILTMLHEFIGQSNYKSAKIIMKILAKSYNYYAIPDFLCRVEIFSYIINISVEILKLPNNNDEYYMKTKKWTSFFLNKASNKGVKKFFKKTELSEFITEASRFSYIYDVFIKQLKMEHNDSPKAEPIKVNTTEFLTLCASNKTAYVYLEKDIVYLITDYIMSLNELNEEEEDCFEYNSEKYLRDKYHYFNYTLRNDASTLFCEIVKNLKHNVNAMNWLLDFFVQIFEAYKNNPSKENLRKKYGCLFLLSNIVHTIFRHDKEKFEYILNMYIFPDIKSNSPILRSQSCYFLSFVEEEVTPGNYLFEALDATIQALRQEHDAIKVDATLAINFFISNPSVSDRFKSYIPEVVQSILTLSSSHDIEPLTFLLDSIMQNYPNDISKFAPGLVSSLGSLIISHLSSNENEGDDRLMVISGFLRSVESIVMSMEDSGPLIMEVYNNFYNVLYYIFSEKKADFFQEALDLTNGFLFSLKRIEKSMCQLFGIILALPRDEIMIYPTEIADVIDNFVSFGVDIVLDPTVLSNIYNIITIYCLADDDNFYDEDFISGCKIIETLLLNVGEKLLALDPQRLAFFINTVIENICRLEEDSVALIYALEVIMHCYYLNPHDTACIMINKQYISRFFGTVFAKKKEFVRVHDKKICIRFLGKLFSADQASMKGYFDISQLVSFFASVLCTLPAAIETRNRLKKQDEESDEDEDYNYDASDDYMELEEDIYHSTVLDQFNPFSYIANIFTNTPQNSVAALVMRNMSNDQMRAINEVFNNNSGHPQQ